MLSDWVQAAQCANHSISNEHSDVCLYVIDRY